MYTLKKLFEIESHCLEMLYSGVMFCWKNIDDSISVHSWFLHTRGNGHCCFKKLV